MRDLNDIIRYVSYYRHQGYSDEQIKQGLIQQGYSYDVIQQVFTSSTKGYHKKTEIFVVLALIILLCGVSVFFFMFNSNKVTNNTKYNFQATTTTSRGLLLTTTTTIIDYNVVVNPIAEDYVKDEVQALNHRYKLSLCYSVNKDREPYCFINPYGDFDRGSIVYLYYRPFLTSVEKNGVNKIGFTQVRKVYDSFGNIISKFNSSPIDYEEEVSDARMYVVPVYDEIKTTTDMSPGEYFIEIKITHKFTGKRERLIIPFYLT